ncbi:MAG: hypothetical protein [Bacteriophage sp.]|nr:MAG: hypothetical protein [Bacteriophage sp.]
MNQMAYDIEKELKISRKQTVVFFKNTSLGDLYEAFEQALNRKCDPFAASVFYNLGKVHGIREERSKRKEKHI